MNESQWDNKLRAFLKKTGDDLKRAGTDIRGEAEKLMNEMKDPDRQEKVKKGLETFKVWARKTAEEVAGVVETGMKKAEGAVRTTAEKVQTSVDTAAAAPSVADEPLRHDTPVDGIPAVEEPSTPAKKTIGTKKKGARSKAGGAKKPLGKKRTP